MRVSLGDRDTRSPWIGGATEAEERYLMDNWVRHSDYTGAAALLEEMPKAQ